MTEPPCFLSLTGYRATGKTAVGTALAGMVEYQFLDCDLLVQELAGKDIATIFAEDGETAFRDLETKVVKSIVQRERVIVALGGGAILREENRRLLQRAGPIVWLKASPQTIRARMSADPKTQGQRPGLTAEGAMAEIERILQDRAPVYAAVANLAIDTERAPAHEIAKYVQSQLFGDRSASLKRSEESAGD